MHLFIMAGIIAVVIYFFTVGPSVNEQDPVGKFIYFFIIPIAIFILSPFVIAIWVLGNVGSMGGNKR